MTLRDVAAAAGVHVSTASRTLNPATRHLVADPVAARVEQAAQKLDYRPDLVAASLRTGRSRLIGVLVPDIADPVFSPILSGIADALLADGYSTVIADVGSNQEREVELVDGLMARRVDGLVLATVSRSDPVVDHCIDRELPVVLVNRSESDPRLSAIVSDDDAGMRLAVEHLADLGHRHIGHVAGPQHVSTGFLRRRGFEAAAAARGIDAAIEVANAYSRAEGARIGGALLDSSRDLTAIVAANDLLALGVYDALRERGLACPQDVSVVGHNDMPLVDMVSPPLTTVRISHREMGEQAARMLLEEISGSHAPQRTVTLAPQLVLRASTRRI
ncbi:MAG TPA: LacI family DNA-binding transcriptional regulator [Alphaproteobacteria bacterium]|nr:LacI family DNA-binding transcriptional regulator [Alphaproteobacteria bacterium]